MLGDLDGDGGVTVDVAVSRTHCVLDHIRRKMKVVFDNHDRSIEDDLLKKLVCAINLVPTKTSVHRPDIMKLLLAVKSIDTIQQALSIPKNEDCTF